MANEININITSTDYMQEQTNQPLDANQQKYQNQAQQEVSFASVPFRLTLNSKQIELNQQISEISSASFDSSSLLQKYQLSYSHLRDYENYLDFQLSRATSTKILLRQTILNFQLYITQQFFQQREILLLIFLVNTIQFQQILEIINTFDLQCEQYTLQKQFNLQNKVIRLNQMLPTHLQSLEIKKKHYCSKFTQFNAIYSQQLKNKLAYLLQAFQSKSQSNQKTSLKAILSSIQRSSFPAISSVTNLYESFLLQIKAKAQKHLNELIDEKQLRSLFIFEHLIKSHFLFDNLAYNKREYLKHTREKMMKTQKKLMLEHLFESKEPRQQNKEEPGSLNPFDFKPA